MVIELFNFGGYGHFIWLAFIFTFVNCYVLYLTTSKELYKKEKLFLSEFKQTVPAKIKVVKQRREVKTVLSGSSIF